MLYWVNCSMVNESMLVNFVYKVWLVGMNLRGLGLWVADYEISACIFMIVGSQFVYL